MQRQELEAAARTILLGNLRRGVADWNGKEFNFVCPSLTGSPELALTIATRIGCPAPRLSVRTVA